MRLTGLIFLVFTALPASAVSTAPCSVQRAASVGNRVWLLCEQREVYVSPDGGVNWQRLRVPTDLGLRSIAFLDERRGFVSGQEGTLMGTTDGGQTWKPVQVPTKENLNSLSFVGEEGWAAGWSGVILHTADGGKTWQKRNSGILQGLDLITFLDAKHGWAVGWAGTLLRTTDGGVTWRPGKTPQNLWSLNAIHFRDTEQGWAVGFNGQILRSRDGGATWEEQKSPVLTWLKWAYFDGSGKGWITADHELLLSEDGGQSWKQVPFEGALFLHQLLPVGDSLWAVGQLGVLRLAKGQSKWAVVDTLPKPAEEASAAEKPLPSEN